MALSNFIIIIKRENIKLVKVKVVSLKDKLSSLFIITSESIKRKVSNYKKDLNYLYYLKK